MRAGDRVFVDTGAWIALAVVHDPLHGRAVEHWEQLQRASARLVCSVPVMIETFTYLDRRGSSDLALTWKDSLEHVSRLTVLGCSKGDLAAAWKYFERRDLHKLSLVDATSFVLMHEHKIRRAFAFDTHFAVAGFRCDA